MGGLEVTLVIRAGRAFLSIACKLCVGHQCCPVQADARSRISTLALAALGLLATYANKSQGPPIAPPRCCRDNTSNSRDVLASVGSSSMSGLGERVSRLRNVRHPVGCYALYSYVRSSCVVDFHLPTCSLCMLAAAHVGVGHVRLCGVVVVGVVPAGWGMPVTAQTAMLPVRTFAHCCLSRAKPLENELWGVE